MMQRVSRQLHQTVLFVWLCRPLWRFITLVYVFSGGFLECGADKHVMHTEANKRLHSKHERPSCTHRWTYRFGFGLI